MRALAEHEVIVEEATVTDIEWIFQLRAHDREPLAAFHTACHDTGIPLDIQRVEHNSDDLAPNGYGLTDKQHAAIVVAARAGYFAVPREATVTALAEMMGISRQAYTRRLQRRLDTVLAHTALADTDLGWVAPVRTVA